MLNNIHLHTVILTDCKTLQHRSWRTSCSACVSVFSAPSTPTSNDEGPVNELISWIRCVGSRGNTQMRRAGGPPGPGLGNTALREAQRGNTPSVVTPQRKKYKGKEKNTEESMKDGLIIQIIAFSFYLINEINHYQQLW